MKNILIVENSYIYLKVLKNLFSDNLKYNIFVARSVKDGIEMMDRNNIDIALLDTMLPDGDGKDLIKHIRGSRDEVLTYILVLTSEVDEMFIGELYTLGIDLYMTKPLNPNILKFTVDRISRRIDNLKKIINCN